MALYLDGYNDYVGVPNNLCSVLGSSASLTCWIKTTQVGSSDFWNAPGITGIEEEGGDNDIFWGWIDNYGKIRINVKNSGGVGSTSAINDNVWHFVAMERNHSSGQLYISVDGSSWNTTYKDTGTITRSFYSFGRIEDTGGSHAYFNGSLADLRIYNTMLSFDEIITIYGCKGTDGIKNGLVYRWPMDTEFPHGTTASGTGTIKDIAGGNNGTPYYSSSVIYTSDILKLRRNV